MSRITTLAAIGLLAVVLAACAGDRDEPAAQPDPPAEDLGETDDPGESDGPDDVEVPEDDTDPADDGPEEGDASTALLDDEVQLAIDDAVDRTGVARDEVTVVTTELVTWPDGSIGCPDPDQMYTMALVDGYRIVLAADGDELAYHGAEGSPPGYCADPQEPAGGNGRAAS